MRTRAPDMASAAMDRPDIALRAIGRRRTVGAVGAGGGVDDPIIRRLDGLDYLDRIQNQ